jgi:hypothetical protein
MDEDFVRRPRPKGFFLSPEDNDHEYEMFTHKLFPETWELLRESRAARPAWGRPSHFSATARMGPAVMNILADCCAGDIFARVTDRSDAYASLTGGYQGCREYPGFSDHIAMYCIRHNNHRIGETPSLAKWPRGDRPGLPRFQSPRSARNRQTLSAMPQ